MRGEVSLTQGPIARSLVLFSVPILLSNLFQQLYNAVDTAVVGRFAGETALAAVGSTGSLINLLIGFFMGLAAGAGILFAMFYGARDHEKLKKLIHCSLLLSVGAGLFITVIGILFCRQMLLWMNTPREVLPLARQYLQVYFAGTVINMLYNVGAGMIRAEGDSRRPLIYLVVGGVTNLVLDVLFVAVFRWGVIGAALATVLAQAVSAVLTLLRLFRLDDRYRLHLRELRFDRAMCAQLVRVSVPCGLQSSMFSISNLLVQAKINSFGAIAMAGVAAYSRIDGFLYMPMMALSMAITTYVGQNVGAGRYDRVSRGVKICTGLGLTLSAGLGMLVAGFCRPLVGLFTTNASAQAYALQMMWFLAPWAWTFSLSDVLGGAIRGSGETVPVTVISALCICVFRVIWLSVVLRFVQDIREVFFCYPSSWVLSTLCTALYYFRRSGLRKAILAARREEVKA